MRHVAPHPFSGVEDAKAKNPELESSGVYKSVTAARVE
jgi:hypothetical protein